MKVQWDVVWSALRTLLVAGGPVATLLIALGFPPVQVSTWMGIALSVIGVLAVVVPGTVGALKQTDAGKVVAAKSTDGVHIQIDPTRATPSVVALAAAPQVAAVPPPAPKITLIVPPPPPVA